MDTSTVFSDDEYDLISNPSHRSPESSVADLRAGLSSKEIQELPPTPAAREKFETAGWSADEIQAYIRKALSLPSPSQNPNPDGYSKTFRIYLDGAFDAFNVGHVLQLRQAKLAFPLVHLIAGVFSDELLGQHGYPSTWSDVERIEMIRHCRWVDEVITDVPWELSEDFVLQRRVDYVAIEEGTSIDPNCDKARVRGYDEIKKIGKMIPTRRTKGFPVARHTITSPPTPVIPVALSLAPEYAEQIDIYGIGY